MSNIERAVEAVMTLNSEDDNTIFIHGNTNTSELSFVIKGNEEALRGMIIGALKSNPQARAIFEQAMHTLNLEKKNIMLN